MTQDEINAQEKAFQRQGFTPNQINFAVAVLRNHVEQLESMIDSLRQQLETMTQAVGLATTIKSDMAIDVRDPIGMMQQVCTYAKSLRQQLETTRRMVEHRKEALTSCMRADDEKFRAIQKLKGERP